MLRVQRGAIFCQAPIWSIVTSKASSNRANSGSRFLTCAHGVSSVLGQAEIPILARPCYRPTTLIETILQRTGTEKPGYPSRLYTYGGSYPGIMNNNKALERLIFSTYATPACLVSQTAIGKHPDDIICTAASIASLSGRDARQVDYCGRILDDLQLSRCAKSGNNSYTPPSAVRAHLANIKGSLLSFGRSMATRARAFAARAPRISAGLGQAKNAYGPALSITL